MDSSTGSHEQQPPLLHYDIYCIVVKMLDPDTLLNFSTCNREFSDMSQALLKVHRKKAKKKRFHTLVLRKSCQRTMLEHNDRQMKDALPLINLLSSDTLVRYVRSVVLVTHESDVRDCGSKECKASMWTFHGEKFASAIREMLERLEWKTNVASTKLRPLFPSFDRRKNDKEYDLVDFLALVLLSLPNMRNLYFENFTASVKLVERIAEIQEVIKGLQPCNDQHKDDKVPTVQPKGLIIDSESLREVSRRLSPPHTIHDFLRFSTFASVIRVYLSDIQSMEILDDLPLPHSGPSSMEALSIESHIKSPRNLAFLLRCSNNLRSFGLWSPFSGRASWIDTQVVIDLLAEHVGDRLQALGLDDNYDYYPTRSSLNFRALENLQFLSLNVRQFFNNKSGISNTRLRSLLNISYYLPPSIGYITIFKIHHMEHVAILLKDIDNEDNGRQLSKALPELKEIKFLLNHESSSLPSRQLVWPTEKRTHRCHIPFRKRLVRCQQLCMEHGVELSMRTSDDKWERRCCAEER